MGIECGDKAFVLRKLFIDFPTIWSALTKKRRACYFTYKNVVRAFRKSYCIRVNAYFIWSSFLITTYQSCLPHNAHLHKPPPKSDHEKKKPTLFPSAIAIRVSLTT